MLIHASLPTVPTPDPASCSLTRDDVWGVFDEAAGKVVGGMIVARGLPDVATKCPIWGDCLGYKSVTVICTEVQEGEVSYWLEFVHGGNSITRRRTLPGGKVALRSEYQCW